MWRGSALGTQAWAGHDCAGMVELWDGNVNDCVLKVTRINNAAYGESKYALGSGSQDYCVR